MVYYTPHADVGQFDGELLEIDIKNHQVHRHQTVGLQWQGDDLIVVEHEDFPADDNAPYTFARVYRPEDEPVPGHESGRIIGPTYSFPPGTQKWEARLRSRGIKPNGESMYSPAEWISGPVVIEEVPPLVNAPDWRVVPTSTFSDNRKRSHYQLDLMQFGEQGIFVNIYLAPADLLTGLRPDQMTDPELLDAVTAEVHRHPTVFDRKNTEPVQINAQNRFFKVDVKGDLQKHFAIAVIGVAASNNREAHWVTAQGVLFKTPQKNPSATLRLLETDSRHDEQSRLQNRLVYQIITQQAIEGPLPKLQIMKSHIETAQRASFFGYFDPQLQVSEREGDDRYEYSFQIVDSEVESWNRYRYDATLLTYSPIKSRYMRAAYTNKTELFCPGRPEEDLIESVTLENQDGLILIRVRFPLPHYELEWRIFDRIQPLRNGEIKVTNYQIDSEPIPDVEADIANENDVQQLNISVNTEIETGFSSCLIIIKSNGFIWTRRVKEEVING